MTRFRVAATRSVDSGGRYPHVIVYGMDVDAQSAADAGLALGNRIRGNDVTGIAIISDGCGHIDVAEGEQAGITDVHVRRIGG